LKALSFSARLSFLFVNRTRREREIFQKAVSSRDDDDFDDGDDALNEEVLFVEIIITIGTPLDNRVEENE
jgi:hypothetical protein